MLVSHDRQFIDNVVTSTWYLDGSGRVQENVGGYSDWQRQVETGPSSAPKPDSKPASREKTPQTRPVKLSYNLQRELDGLPEKIETLESRQEKLTADISDPAFYGGDADTVQRTLDELKTVADELEQLYDRWGELES